MPQFFYTAVSHQGQRTSGIKEAANSSELAKLLREEGFILTSVKAAQKDYSDNSTFKRISGIFRIFGRISLAEKMLFARHLSVMVKAGFSLNKALQVLAAQTKNSRFAKIIADLEESVRKGNSFGDSLTKYPDVFSDLFVNMVRVGETSGSLDENLNLLAIQMKKDYTLLSKVKGAMMYPAVILVAMIGVGVAMMVFVMPKLMAVFTELNVPLPLATQVILNISKFLSENWLPVLIVLIAVIVSTRIFLRTKQGKIVEDKLILKMPIFGNISKKVNSARMARTFSSLIESGVSIVRTLEITSGTLTNVFFQRSLLEAAKEVQKGEPLSAILAKFSDLYPPLVTQMIQVGEETGTLGDITKRLAEFHEEEVANITKNLSSIIEPILMVIIGAAVGFFAISMIQPMYSMMNSL